MKQIALIHGHSVPFFDEWHHVGFWKKTFDEMPDVQLHLYTWETWQNMPEGLDLYLFLDYRPILWKVAEYDFHPRALFWWDAFHHMQSVSIQLSLIFDKVYTAEYVEAKYISNVIGFSNTEWLPGAYYPGLYHPIVTEKKFNFGFIGQFDNTVIRKGITRKGLLDDLCNRYSGFVSNDCRGPITNEIYNQSRILPERTIFANIGTRLFEVVGSGGFCLINKFPCANGLGHLGEDGKHFVTYDESLEDFREKFNYYLTHEDEREKIASAGQKHFSENHTYVHRIKKIFGDFDL